jgi:hypothetical protein
MWRLGWMSSPGKTEEVETPQERFERALCLRRVSEIRSLLAEHPGLDVNIMDPVTGDFLLHGLCRSGRPEDLEIVSLLLRQPACMKNVASPVGHTPFATACIFRQTEIFKLLLRTPGVDINRPDVNGRSPLWWLCFSGRLSLVKLMIAEREDLDMQALYEQVGDPLRWVRANSPGLEPLFERLGEDRDRTRRELRLELGLARADAAALFALVVFFCDGFLRLRTTAAAPSSARFFSMAAMLPIELQMLLCNRAFLIAQDGIRDHDSETAFRRLAQMY